MVYVLATHLEDVTKEKKTATRLKANLCSELRLTEVKKATYTCTIKLIIYVE